MAILDAFLERNSDIIKTHEPLPLMSEAFAKGLALPPRPVIISCCDPRCHPEYYFGLNSTEAVVIRNAGGRVTSSVLENIVAIDALGGLSEIAVVHHTDCGAFVFDNEKFRAIVVKRGISAEEASKMEFGGFHDLEQGVKDDLAILRSSNLLRPELAKTARGFTYDITTGKVALIQE